MYTLWYIHRLYMYMYVCQGVDMNERVRGPSIIYSKLKNVPYGKYVHVYTCTYNMYMYIIQCTCTYTDSVNVSYYVYMYTT